MSATEKSIMLICSSLLLFFAGGCKDKPKNPVSEYGDSLLSSYRGAHKAADQANLDALKAAINTYRAEKEKYPDSLQEVGNMLRSQIDFSKYDYDTVTGTVTLKLQQ